MSKYDYYIQKQKRKCTAISIISRYFMVSCFKEELFEEGNIIRHFFCLTHLANVSKNFAGHR